MDDKFVGRGRSPPPTHFKRTLFGLAGPPIQPIKIYQPVTRPTLVYDVNVVIKIL